jgi:hypothetical protein
MFIEAKLVFQSYVPTEFEIGMLFLRKVRMIKLKTLIEYDEVFELKQIPGNREAFLLLNGWPVAPFIYSLTANPDAFADILANPGQIGWWDDGPESDELRDISIKEYNYILENYDGHINIEIKDDVFEAGIAEPILYNDKVTLREPMEEYIDDYDEDTPPDDYEDWDDMDDLTDYDNPEWPNDHPKDKWNDD